MKCDLCNKKAKIEFETLNGKTRLCRDHQQKAGFNPVFGKNIEA